MLRISLFGERHLKSKCCCLNRHIFATKSSISPCRRDEGIFKPRIGLELVELGNAAEHSVFVQVAAAINGVSHEKGGIACLMSTMWFVLTGE